MSLSRLPLTVGAIAASLLIGACQHQLPVATSAPSAVQQATVSDQDISDAYIYLLGRLLVLRQQQLDFREGMAWNQLVHRRPGAVDWPNPNLDVAYSEAWVAVDETSCTIVTVPKISGRYYTVQFLNGWGETLANINERTFPGRPSGDFAVCLRGANVALPADVTRIDLPARHTRVLSRVELGADWKQAEALQHQFSMRATGTPRLPRIPQTPVFDLQKLPGVEAFDAAEAALASEPDLNPGMEAQQAKVHALVRAIASPAERDRVDSVIRKRAFADFARASRTIGPGSIRNGWTRAAVSGAYGNDYLSRTLFNYGGIWVNTFDEANYFRGAVDGAGAPLDSSHTYSLTFPKDQLPAAEARYFWSVLAVDSRYFRVLPNPMNRFLLNNQSRLQYGKDGSLTLYFGPKKPEQAPEGNWLPTPAGQQYRLMLRFYGPRDKEAAGKYVPPPIVRLS
ncbi:hypothetical protein LMG31506_04412 [Cupriavidus yeoncheonensis]|uniref:DUF1254 domain-containing protein n=1 Tax=Cupriavidus yeoncheonensis TaxID=1462994 RepID=A0A916MZC6_9BURK|nr:DUF1214 domain-containing protein [Cupriavidus yeoncheonensis]CAG2151442.1 hypothetical protein LMG31506_04412 [Cupriavidus yeoncheonensis]